MAVGVRLHDRYDEPRELNGLTLTTTLIFPPPAGPALGAITAYCLMTPASTFVQWNMVMRLRAAVQSLSAFHARRAEKPDLSKAARKGEHGGIFGKVLFPAYAIRDGRS